MYKLTQYISQSILAIILAFLTLPAIADDTKVYSDLKQCLASNNDKYRFIFIVDNSSSMKSLEFQQSKETIDATIREVLNSDLNDVQVAVVQYGTDANNLIGEHFYDVSVPFTASASTATSWNRHYGIDSPNPSVVEDHQPASLSRMRLDDVYAPGGALDVTDGTNVQFVFFTDAFRNISAYCCSALVNEDNEHLADPSNVLPGFGEYDAIKNGSVLPNGLKGQFTILHVPPTKEQGIDAAKAAAAIASPGGNYTGAIEDNPNDPEGPGRLPRRYVQGNFSVNDSNQIITLIQQVLEEIKETTYVNVAPTVSVNAFNELQHRDEIYFALFQPSSRARWSGNVKKFTINPDGVILDSRQQPAIDPNTGAVNESAKSYWSSTKDGALVAVGGYRGKLTDNQTIYTDPTAFNNPVTLLSLLPIASDSDIKLDLMNLADQDSNNNCVLIGEKVNGSLTVNSGVIEAESDIDPDAGNVKLSFTASSTVSSKVVLVPRQSTEPNRYECVNTYPGSTEFRQCEFSIGTDIQSLRLEFSDAVVPAEVEYVLEYNIPEGSSPTACGTVQSQRQELLSWLTGIDAYSENVDNPSNPSHQFAADPLHSKPFVITYSGTSADDAEEVMFFTDNLGALHAIDPDDKSGEKLWSYLPEEHLDNVRRYALNKAGQTKTYGLDGYVSVVQREASDSSRERFSLREVKLYIGERRGGRNYYSIDVSNATSTSNNKPTVDWKIRGGESARFEDLGQTWSRMLPRRIAYNCNALGEQCQYLEVLIFSGGYDPAYDESGALPMGTLGNALYIVDLETGGDKFFWSAGNNADARNAHSHALSLDMEHSIVATPTSIDTNGDGAVDILFANDISGKLWRIDFDGTLTKGSETTDTIDSLSALGGSIADLSGEAGVQRFYNTPDVSRTNPRFGINQYLITTGSGHRANPNDLTDGVNHIFVVYDPNIGAFKGDTADPADLYKYVNGERIITTDDLIEVFSSETLDESYGVFLPATDSGEKFLQPAVTLNNTVIVSSYLPGAYTEEDCSVGSGRTYFLESQTLASRFTKPYVELELPGIPPETSILRLPKIAICVGTNCAAATYTPEGDSDECATDEFSADNYGNDFSAAVASTVCGLEIGRAYRSSWHELSESD